MSQAQLLAVLGSGGVGKTTSSAALALALAKRGYRTVVITVDPAHRLAQVLGLEALSNEPREIARFDNGGALSALWLDTNEAIEDLIRRYIGSAPLVEKILNHRLFKIVRTQLGGVEEYVGVEKILELRRSGKFDICILDTPPSRHALDFLESPRHLLRFFDEGILKVFLSGGSEEESRSGFFSKIFRGGRDQVLDLFKTFLGSTFLGELAELLQNLKPVHQVFRTTAQEIELWVKEASTHFILVTLLEAYPLDEARLLSIELSAHELAPPSLLVLNKCLPRTSPPKDAFSKAFGAEGAAALQSVLETQQNLRARLQKEWDPQTTVAEVPRYSVKHLSQQQLLDMGTGIVETWLSKDPKVFSQR